MPDPIQASSSIPLPSYQTVQGTQDPLPVASGRAIDKSAGSRREADVSKATDDFKSYLDQTSITTVERQKPKTEADPIDLLLQNSAYGQQGISVPL